ncbi:chaperonin 10-like protein [Stachybotrys elegans]|uniref:Chaperonin 10-like protein n=1 Tax=Stachybotrys elegans TaxID=80388 RepID=A0A8K0SEA5_9HYPO|nr:chaperonin 10-like protein [Stachybotrys elegans]
MIIGTMVASMKAVSTATVHEIDSPQMEATIPPTQKQLLLYGKGQPYKIQAGNPLPHLNPGELLVEIHSIGLNPIDWKSAAFGFGLPQLPSLNGREFTGRIVASYVEQGCSLEKGELVLAVSTDYRDFRKAAFQEYAIVSYSNAIRIPRRLQSYSEVASIGVAYVAASITLGVCFGISFTRGKGAEKCNFNLLDIAQSFPDDLPNDVASEVLHGISFADRPFPGEWILVYGASSVSAQVVMQLAKLLGFKVIGVADLEKHKVLLSRLGADLLVDKTNLEDASRQVQELVTGPLRFAVDTIGPETASWCQKILAAKAGSPPAVASEEETGGRLGHLVALTGGPKTSCPTVQVHKLPIKLFHTIGSIGVHLGEWLYELLDTGALKLPEVEFVNGGLEAVNTALDKLRAGKVSGKRLVVNVRSGF